LFCGSESGSFRLPTKSKICRLASCLFLLFWFLLSLAPAARARPQDSSEADANPISTSLDPPSFAAELRRIQGAIGKDRSTPQQIAQVRDSLPGQWNVKTTDGDYQISSQPLRSLLSQAEKDPAQRQKLIADANQWLDEESAQVESYAKAGSDNDPGARAALAEILTRREFSGLRTMSAQELLRERINQWIEHIVEWIFGHIGRHETGAKVFFELLLLAAVIWLGALLVRFWMRRARIDEFQAPQSIPIARSWQEWIRAAREASDRSDFREAVHSTYWAGIAYLESTEVIEPDRTRTPREYVRLLSKPRPETLIPLEKPRAALAALTTRLEQVWYGQRPASREDFTESIQQIEGLGCQLP
jgi:Domain of unknown function (DUF4129)